jgi:hypothetical protein
MWGYLPLGNRPSFTEDKSLSYPAFHLHLAGSGDLDIPEELREVVITHVDLNYGQYYDVMGGMDVCVPAFAGTGSVYYSTQASSTVAMCTEVNVSAPRLLILSSFLTSFDKQIRRLC